MNLGSFGKNGDFRRLDEGVIQSDAHTAKALRRQLVGYINQCELPVDEKKEVLIECAHQIEDCRFVEAVARAAGLTLSHFLTNDALELHYQISRGRHDIGYVSKGWGEPGFRIGEVLTFADGKGIEFIWAAPEIERFCAVNGIGITFEQHGETTEVHLDGVLYQEGFNKTTFLNTLEALDACLEKIESLMPNT